MAKSKQRRAEIAKLRIIGGEWRGRKLEFPILPGLRPTPDRIRETLFNWLAPHIVNARCLDLYCGSGALGLECLSRGAAAVTLIDSAAAVGQCVARNRAAMASDRAQFVQADVLDWLSKTTFDEPYDIVFVDPPYDQRLLQQTFEELQAGNAIRQNSWVYTEAPRKNSIPAPLQWQLHRDKQAGSNHYCLFFVRDHAIPALSAPL